MKRILSLLILCVVTVVVQGKPIVIHGKPVELEVHQGFFTFPEDYKRKNDFHYVIISGVKRVCFLQEKQSLSPLDLITVMIEAHGVTLRWFCYEYDPKFFEVDF